MTASGGSSGSAAQGAGQGIPVKRRLFGKTPLSLSASSGKSSRSTAHEAARPGRAAPSLTAAKRNQPSVGLGVCSSRVPLIKRSKWKWLPQWIALYAERGAVHRCWEGHRLKRERQDGRVHKPCVFCEEKAARGRPIWCCRECRWTLCQRCADERPRLPPLEKDPLFHGPTTPRLLPPPNLENASSASGTVIICPGGNYEFLVPQEGMPAAQLLASHGIRAFVLRYRLLPAHDLEDMLSDLESAIGLVRQSFGGPVATMGFSAGGHLVASHAVRSASARAGRGGTPDSGAAVVKQQVDAQVLVYPCIDPSDWAHEEWCGFFNWDASYPVAKAAMLTGREALCGGPGFAAPPTLMVASTVDEASPPKEHTDRYAKALRRHGIPYHYLRRDFGPHGFGLTGGWTRQCIEWLHSRGFGTGVSPACNL